MNDIDQIRFTISHEEDSMRIDKCLTLKLGEEYSRVFVRMMLDKKLVSVDGKNVKPSYSVSEGEEVVYSMPEAEETTLIAEDIPITVIYEDESIIVIDKPAGMVVHPGSGNKSGTLANALLYHCKNLADTGDVTRPGIVHRLDKDTSGVMVAAKDERTLRSLSRQFQKRKIKKRYIALVAGRVEADSGVVDVPIARDEKDRKKMAVNMDIGKEARTVFHVAKRFKRFTVLKVEPETGRTHQIRIHMKHIGHPVLGDMFYGKGNEMPRQALHAEKIIITHPGTKEQMEFRSPVPDDIIKVIKRGDF